MYRSADPFNFRLPHDVCLVLFCRCDGMAVEILIIFMWSMEPAVIVSLFNTRGVYAWVSFIDYLQYPVFQKHTYI